METNEIMNNEEVIETTAEEVTKVSSGKGFKVAAGIGLAVLVGVIAYKYVGKPVIAKIKAKKEEATVTDAEHVNGEIVLPEESEEEE